MPIFYLSVCFFLFDLKTNSRAVQLYLPLFGPSIHPCVHPSIHQSYQLNADLSFQSAWLVFASRLLSLPACSRLWLPRDRPCYSAVSQPHRTPWSTFQCKPLFLILNSSFFCCLHILSSCNSTDILSFFVSDHYTIGLSLHVCLSLFVYFFFQ